MAVNKDSATRLGGVARLIAEAEHLVANREPDQREVTSKAQRSKIEAMSAMGQKETSREATDKVCSWRLSAPESDFDECQGFLGSFQQIVKLPLETPRVEGALVAQMTIDGHGTFECEKSVKILPQ